MALLEFSNHLPTLLSSINVKPVFMLILKSQLQIFLLRSAVPGVLPGPLLIGEDTDS